MAKIKPSAPTKNIGKRKSSLDKNGLGVKKSGKTRRGKRRFKRRPIRKRQPAGVVYLSHIPHGFYEEQIEAYFSQFGKVNAVSVPRSKSGRAKGYAFIEYKYPEIAKIAADTMNNYLMFNRLLKAKYIPPEEQKPHLFRMAVAARANHKTAVDKAELALKHNRKLKNRHLKIGLEAKLAKKLLKKKNALMKRAEKLGAGHDFMVEEANVQAIFQRQMEIEARKKNKSNEKDPKSGHGETTDSSEEELSSAESDEGIMSFGSDQSLLEDGEDILSESEEEDFESASEEEDVESMSEEEDYKTVIAKAKKAAIGILKEAKKTKKNQKPKQRLVKAMSAPTPLDLPSPPKKETIVNNKNKSLNNILQTSNIGKKAKKISTPSLTKSPKKGVVVVVNDTIDNNITPKVTVGRKSISKNVLTEKTPSSVKKNKVSPQTPVDKKTDIPQVVMEVDNSDEEINFKTPPNVVKKFIKTGKDSSNKTPKEKSYNRPSLTPKKLDSLKKLPKGLKSPGKHQHQKSPSTSGKKLRHRKLKHSLSPK